ncbi:MAG: Gfo/Idh/MocA family protein [Gammaproteobacteria bacterium]
MSHYSVAIVGFGRVTSSHINALKQIPNVNIVAIVSNHLTQNEYDKTKIYGDLPVFKTIDALIDSNVKVDVIDICSRPDFHKEQVIQAARAGKHLIIEKPIALNLYDCKAIEDAVETSKVQACVCFECRFSDQFEKTKHAIETYLGEIRYRNVSYFHGIGPQNPEFPWNTKISAGGSSLLSAGCHALDGLLYFMDGAVDSVYATSTKQTNPDFVAYEYDPIQSIVLNFKDGRIGTLTSNIAHIGRYYFPIHLSGNRGTLIGNNIYTDSGEHITLDMKLLGSGNPDDHPYQNQFKAFFKSLTKNESMEKTNLSIAIKMHEVIEAAALSIKEKRLIYTNEL